MNKNLFFIAAATLAFAACSSNDVVEEIQEKDLPMVFEPLTENATRASASTNLEDYHQSFGVWSWKQPAAGDPVAVIAHYGVFYNDNGTGSVDWDYDGTKGAALSQTLKYWDRFASYSFYAYAPFNSTNASINTSTKKISIADNEYAANENLQSWGNTLNTAVFTGTGASSTSATTDWMLADDVTGYTAYGTPVGEAFKHTLTKVIVILKHSANFAKDIVVTSVSVDDVHGKGSFNGTAWNATDAKKSIAGATGTISAGTDKNFYCMEYLVMPSTDAPKFSVSYTIDGEPFVVTAQAITNVTSLAANTAYTITATIGPDPIEFDATVSDFTPDETGSVTVQ